MPQSDKPTTKDLELRILELLTEHAPDRFYLLSFRGLCNIIECNDDSLVTHTLQILADERHITIGQAFNGIIQSYIPGNDDLKSFLVYPAAHYRLEARGRRRCEELKANRFSIMKLSRESEKLIESQYAQAAQEISSKHHMAVQKLERTMSRGGAMKGAIDEEYTQMAKELVQALLNAYLAAFSRENVIPDDRHIAQISSEFEEIVRSISHNTHHSPLPSSQENYRSIVPRARNELILAVKKMQLEQRRMEARPAVNITVNNQGGIMGDQYNIGQAGAVGPNAHAHDMTFNQIGSQIETSMDLSQLADALSNLRKAMSQEANEAEHHIAIGEIAKAEQAARAKDSSKVAEYLRSAGKWAFDFASKIGASLAAEAIKIAMGMK